MQIIAIFSLFLALTSAAVQRPTIVLNPAGDAKTTGRQIHDNFERSYTLQIAQALKKRLESELPAYSVVVTRIPGETPEPLEYASFANRIDAALYLSIHCFHEENVKPRLYIYQFSYAEPCIPLPRNQTFYTYDQAHLLQINKTINYSSKLTKELRHDTQYLDIQGPYQLPFAPLIGIVCPAFGIEIGLKDALDWHNYIEPLARSIMNTITQH